MNFPYQQTFTPPAPTLMVEVFSPDTPDQRRTVLAKLDTAADITAVPANLLHALDAEIFSTTVISGYGTSLIAVNTYVAGIELPNARIKQVEVVPISEDYVLLGRDVLNNFYINLNGPELTFDVEVTRTKARK